MTMKQTRLLMGMPVTLEIVDVNVTQKHLDEVFAYFVSVDETFSTYKATSEISRINTGELSIVHASASVQTIMTLSERTKEDTRGFFDIHHNGVCDPSGLVKGWAISNASNLLKEQGFRNFYIDAGGDVQVVGKKNGKQWLVANCMSMS